MRRWICLLSLASSLVPLCHGCHGKDDDIRGPTASRPVEAAPLRTPVLVNAYEIIPAKPQGRT